MEKVYAQALWEMVSKGMDPKKAVHAMHEMLQEQGREALMPHIARAFERLAERIHTRDTITLTVADKAHEHAAHKAASAALLELGVEAAQIETRVDHSLIGGWRLEGREHLVDESFKKHLLAIYTAATS